MIMMNKHYMAVTYDLCEHNDLCEDMNEYILDASDDIEKQVKEFSKVDVAPLVKVYVSETHDFKEAKRSEEHTSELQSRFELVCRLLLEKKNSKDTNPVELKL